MARALVNKYYDPTSGTYYERGSEEAIATPVDSGYAETIQNLAESVNQSSYQPSSNLFEIIKRNWILALLVVVALYFALRK